MLLGGPGRYAQVHAAADGSSDFAAKSIREANPALPHMPALARVIEREKRLAEAGRPDLDAWRTYPSQPRHSGAR